MKLIVISYEMEGCALPPRAAPDARVPVLFRGWAKSKFPNWAIPKYRNHLTIFTYLNPAREAGELVSKTAQSSLWKWR